MKLLCLGDPSELVQRPAAALRPGPGAGIGRRHYGDAARPWRPFDVGNQRRVSAPGEDLPGQHRPAVPACPGGMDELIGGLAAKHGEVFVFYFFGQFLALLD